MPSRSDDARHPKFELKEVLANARTRIDQGHYVGSEAPPLWLLALIRSGEATDIPELDWERAQPLLWAIDGYELSGGGPAELCKNLGPATKPVGGVWPGDAATLWIAAFYQQRKWRGQEYIPPDVPGQLDRLAQQLRAALMSDLDASRA